MKEIKILMVLLIAFICIGTISCTKDDDENGENDKENIDKDDDNDQVSIIGTWEFDDGDGWTMVYKFSSNGSFKETDTEIYNGKPDVYMEEGTYKYNTNKKTLTLSYDDNTTTQYKVISLTSQKLTLQYEDEEDGGIEKITFTRQ